MTKNGILVVLGFLLFGCDGSEGIQEVPNRWPGPANSGQRQIAEVEWDTLWTIGGTESADSVLVSPTYMRLVGEQLVVVDRIARNISGFSLLGSREWVVGRGGQGPGELSRTVLNVAEGSGGAVHAYDFDNSRVLSRTPTGDVTETSIDGLPARALTFSALPDGSYLFVVGHGAPLVEVNRDGEVVDRSSFKWEGFAALPMLSRAGSIAQDGERWIYIPFYGNAWFAYEGRTPLPYTGRLVEHREFASPVVTVSGDTRTSTVVDNRCAACSVSIDGSQIFVLHGGSTDAWQTRLDVYRWRDGSYEYTLELPERLDHIVVRDGTVFGLYVADGVFPAMIALRWRIAS